MNKISAAEITQFIKRQLENFESRLAFAETGIVVEAGDGIARVFGLEQCMYNELLEFPDNVYGVAFNLEEDNVGVVVLGDYLKIKEGQTVRRTNRILSVPVGEQMTGRVVNALGEPVDGKSPIETEQFRPIEHLAPGVVDRRPVHQSLQTGLKAIDAMIPIGRGQRELIIGDRQTGKTAIAIDTIINQKGGDVVCIYVAVGQKQSTVARLVKVLEEYGSMDYTIIVQACASEPAPMLYIAPFSGCAMGEFFLHKGKHALLIYDDLSKHAAAYRQLSLLLRRPPGREAFPGDVFYLHSRLLERAVKLADDFIIVRKDAPEDVREGFDGKRYRDRDDDEKKELQEALEAAGDSHEIRHIPESGGSLTALPIIETQAGDVSAYIPTNVISITDGQIYLEKDLFYSGVKPAVNPGISVSRVGGAAQIRMYRKIAGLLRLDLASYRELAAFAQFGSDLDPATQKQLARGERLTEILKQDQYKPLPVEDQIAIIYAATKGFLDDLPIRQIRAFEAALQAYLKETFPEFASTLKEKGVLDDEMIATLEESIRTFKTRFLRTVSEAAEEVTAAGKAAGT
ncbi:F0F1 ATP synthase subunit alpha [bacterium]|nr:F0F1 ATP synthase subunit alpha [candidate division CSSED10-310 bacterium]